MSQERTVLGAAGKSMDELIEESRKKNQDVLSRAERKKQLTEVLERGRVLDRLKVDLPPGVYGEWVPDDDIEIARMEALGFTLDTEYANKRRLHSEGDSKSRVGDVIFMTCSKEDHELLEEVKHERYIEAHHPKKQKEESEFKSLVNKATPELPVIDESRTRQARKTELEEALGKKT